jgi:PAS domain S-box-containing protein
MDILPTGPTGPASRGTDPLLNLQTLARKPWDLFDLVESKCGLGMWLMDLDTREMRWSRGMYNLLGLSAAETNATLETIDGVLHPAERSYSGAVLDVITDATPLSHQFRVVQPNGLERWLTSHIQLLSGDVSCRNTACGIIADVTAWSEATRRLKISAKRQDALSEKIGYFSWKTGAGGSGPTAVVWQKLTGQSPAESRGLGWLDAVHPDDREAMEAAWTEAVASASAFSAKFRLQTAAGAYRWFVAYGKPVACQNGETFELVGACVDVHDHEGMPVADAGAMNVTGAHLRAARALVDWTVRDLAEAADVSSSVIRRLEERIVPPISEDPKWSLVRQALEMAGAEFFAVDGDVAVRSRPSFGA